MSASGMSDQRARLPQLGSSSIIIGTQFDKAFLDPGFVFCLGLRNLIIGGVDVLLKLLQLRLIGLFMGLDLIFYGRA